MTLHVRQSDRSRARPTQWTPWGAMPATREPACQATQTDQGAAPLQRSPQTAMRVQKRLDPQRRD